MKKETNNAIYIYDVEDKSLIDEISIFMDDNSKRIIDFFELDNIDKPLINIVKSKEELDKIFVKFNKPKEEVPKWLIGMSTSDMNIYCLSLNDYKNTTHAFKEEEYDKALNNYKKTVLHEYIHYVNRCFCKLNNSEFSIKYLSEGIASYFSNQKEDIIINFDYSINDLLNSNNCYDGWFLITKYIIEKYPKKILLELLINKNKAKEFLENKYIEIKNYYIKNN